VNRLVLILAILLGAGAWAPVPAFSAEAAPRRIVSLAPSVTEVLFAVGAGDLVVGVTDWCAWPPEARALPKVGGHVDPNIEVVASLRPDLVVLEVAATEARARFERLGLTILAVEHRDLEGVLESLTVVGEACGTAETAEALRRSLTARLEAVRVAASRRSAVRALVVIGRDIGGGELRDVYAAGRGTFLGELLEAAGGVNACSVEAIRYPTLTREALMRMAPDVVFELAPEMADVPDGSARLQAAWRDLRVPAGLEGRVHVILDNAPMIPGPRVIDTLELFASALADAANVGESSP